MQIQAAAIPTTLKQLPRWVLWRYEERKGKRTKPPYSVLTGQHASSTDPGTWTSFAAALAKLQAASEYWEGVGFVFSTADDLMGMDLDHCRDPDTGAIDAWALAIVQAMDTYTEATPSGTGLHLIFRASLPMEGRKGPRAEVYQAGRYFTMTGRALEGYAGEPAERQLQAEAVVRDLFPAHQKPDRRANGSAGPVGGVTEREIIEHVRKNPFYERLWRGDFSAYTAQGKSQSEADLALVGYIGFFAGPDEPLIDAVFRQSQLYREKWERADYRARTFRQALTGKTEFYSWGHPAAKTGPAGRVPRSSLPAAGPAPGGSADQESSTAELVWEPAGPPLLTDLGNAQRLVVRHGKDLRYTPSHGWLVWDRRRWRGDNSGQVMRRAKETARAIHREAAAVEDPKEQQKVSRWAIESQSRPRLEAMVELAKTEPEIVVDASELDADPYLFNCQSGTIELLTGTHRAHRREDLITHLAPVEYRADARDPIWESFLESATGGDVEFQRFLQRAGGVSLSGDTGDDAIFLALGPTRTGKSTFLSALDGTLGTYAERIDFETLLVRDTVGQARPDVAKLVGKRFVSSVETEKGKRFAAGLMKHLSGGEKISCRFLFKNEFTYQPQFKLWLACNDAPEVADDDEAFWYRLKRLPFVHRPAKLDPAVRAHLRNPRAAGGAILAWLVQGFLDYRREGLGMPETIRTATFDYRTEMDPLAAFFPDYAFLDGEGQAAASGIWAAYQRFVRDAKIKQPLSRKTLAGRLERRGCQVVHTRVGNVWRGIRLVSDPSLDHLD